MPDTTIGKYRLVGELGKGAMGTVYKAVDETLHREVAVKILSSQLAHAGLLERFRTEATALARLNHPAIATIYELVEADHDLVMVMELVRGETLEAFAARLGPLDPARAVHLVDQILSALEHAHRARIVHCDIKPANVMVTDAGAVKIMDFGIAHMCGDDLKDAAGGMTGTPGYMAPEQALGGDVDERADLYAVGVVLYRLLTGALPFAPGTTTEILRQQIADSPAPLRAHLGGLPAWCEDIIARALARTPADRFQTAEEFRAVLARATRPATIERTDRFAPGDLARPSLDVGGRAAAGGDAMLGAPQVSGGRYLAAAGVMGFVLVVGVAAVAYGVGWQVYPVSPTPMLPSRAIPFAAIPSTASPSTTSPSVLLAEARSIPVARSASAGLAPTTTAIPAGATRSSSPLDSPQIVSAADGKHVENQEGAAAIESVERGGNTPAQSALGDEGPSGTKAVPPFAFSAKKLIEGGDRLRERDVHVFFAEGRVIVSADALPNDVVHEKTYEAIRTIDYSKSHHPLRRSPAGPVRAARAGRVGVFPRTRHWITLRTDDANDPLIVLRVENEAEMKRVIEAIETRTHLIVSTLVETADVR
jgi:serine/threonine-protein kinase